MKSRLDFNSNDTPLACMITEGVLDPANYTSLAASILLQVETAVELGLGLVQVREKHLAGRLLTELTAKAVTICAGSKTAVMVNDRFDIALAAGAAGVHLTSLSMDTRDVRIACPEGFLIGVSTHSREEAVAARDSGADYVFFGPVFDTPSKRRYGPPKGIDELAAVSSIMEAFPVVAVGGIDQEMIDVVLSAGAAGYAAIRMFALLKDSEGLRSETRAQ